MDLNEIRKILDLMDANGLVEFEYEEQGRKIRLRRPDSGNSAGSHAAPDPPAHSVPVAPESGEPRRLPPRAGARRPVRPDGAARAVRASAARRKAREPPRLQVAP